MINIVNKYFAEELTPEEKELFLSEIYRDKNLRKEFIEVQKLVAYTDLLPRRGDKETAWMSLSHFIQQIKNK